HARGSSEAGAIAATNAGGRVLVVDDVRSNLRVAQSQLTRLGYAVETDDDSAHALETAVARSFSAVLIDLSMPGLDGVAFTRELRRRELGSGHRTPVVILTGHSPEDARRMLSGCEVDEVLHKPVTLAALAVC